MACCASGRRDALGRVLIKPNPLTEYSADCRAGIAKAPAAIHHGCQWGEGLQAGQGRTTMSDASNLISRILLSAVIIVYGYLAFADVKSSINFNQAAINRFFDIVAGGIAPATWFAYVIAGIQLFGTTANLVRFKTHSLLYPF